MITGAHAIIYSTRPEADRAFFRDVLKLTSVDAGEGWMIFGLPPSEVAVHPSEKNDAHELYLLVQDVGMFIGEMGRLGIACTPVQRQSWGALTRLTLPGGGTIGVYEPNHPRPPQTGSGLTGANRSGKARKSARARSGKKAGIKSRKR